MIQRDQIADAATDTMNLVARQPCFAPFPGFFQMASGAEVVVLLDDVQFPRGTTWITRNRFKGPGGELWLTVPVWKKGRGLQQIRDVEMCYEGAWMHKHIESLRCAYRHAPHYECHGGFLEALYGQKPRHLVSFNIAILRHIWEHLGLKARLVLQSDLGVRGTGTDLLVALCGAVGADLFIAQKSAAKYLDTAALARAAIDVRYANPRPVIYPQLWGSFLPNLSILDVLFTCGDATRGILGIDQETVGARGTPADPQQGV